MKNPFRKENDRFSVREFQAPSIEFAMTFNWVWNGELSHEETDRQLDEFERMGIRAICMVVEPKEFRPMTMPSLLSPDYLTKPYFEEYRYAVQRAKEKGMLVWLYDEGGWPSGGACGKVMIQHPEYARRNLAKREKVLRSGEVYRAADDVRGASVNGEAIADGFVAECDCKVVEYYERASLFDAPGVPELPDVTRKEATECFLELTHEGYRPYLEEFFGETIPAVFSDEPRGPAIIPFRAELEQAFKQENGYSIRPFLPQLLGDGTMTAEAAQAKIAWLDLCSRAFCQNYLLTEKEWCNRHGMMFTGHFGGDHDMIMGMTRVGYYHLLRSLRCFDIPGIDAIWRQIFPVYTDNKRQETGRNNGIFPRYASSAAAQTGSRFSMTESFGVYGAGLTFSEMRYVLNYQAVRGINVFNAFGVPYSRTGFHMTGEMPHFTEKHACYQDLPAFNRFAERLAYLNSLGERVADTAYYMPVNDLWVEDRRDESAPWFAEGICPKAQNFERLGSQLEDANLLFDVIDDDVLAASAETAQSGILSMGNAAYRYLILPYCEYIPQKSLDTIHAFLAGGGTVFVVSETEIPQIRGAVTVQNVENIIPKALELSEEADKIRLGVRKTETGTLYLLFNESNEKKMFQIRTEKKLVRLFAESGTVVEPLNNTVLLQSGEMAFFFDGEMIAEEETVYEHCADLNGPYFFRKTNRFRIGEMEFISEDLQETEREILLGDWTESVGIEFSGSCVYRTTLRKPKESGKILLELGDVHYSCEVSVNGIAKGKCVMPPYRIELRAEELTDENVLEIRVSNTAANEYQTTKSFEKWKPWQLSTYHEIQKLYHLDSMSGGLYGPVRIFY